jgi:RNA:NAD 2'-phosphotransferase (TPT1/KptA family)
VSLSQCNRSTKAMDYATLSRLVSNALRHEPNAYGLELDPEGWVEVNALLEALKRRSSGFADLTDEKSGDRQKRNRAFHSQFVTHPRMAVTVPSVTRF